MNPENPHASADAQWKDFLSHKARRSHITMAWCGAFIFPAFVLLDLLVLDEWELFLIVRLCGTVAIVAMISLKDRLNFSDEFIAHFSCHVVFVSLMWMLSWLPTPNLFFIYAFNTSVGYIISAIFLLWRPRNSVFGMITTVSSFLVFYLFFSTLSVTEIITHGFLVLMAAMAMTTMYVSYRYSVTYRDFLRQLELNRAYDELKLKSFEINQRNFEVIQQKEKLEELNSLKDKIFMIISHDLRSPLHSLKALIILLNESELITPQEFKMLLKGLKHNVDQTYDLLDNLLVWSKSQMKGFVVRRDGISIHDIVAETTALLLSNAEKKKLNIVNHIHQHLFARGDEDMIKLVLRNLISNAIKFTGEGGCITIGAKQDGQQVMISVSDTGVGIDILEQSEVFKYSQSKTGTNEEKGAGLGLMICKEFIEKNHGRIWIDSELGRGSTFTFSLPAIDKRQKSLASASLRSSR
ncbi:MAG TPA: HAMP domain-containing sensor histidine kinase [Chryseosolibacter sp.]